MNFNDLSYDDLDQHVMEQLIFREDEVSPLLRGHLLIEKILETLLSSNLPNPSVFFKRQRSFELKVDLAAAMALLNAKHVSAFKALNNVRNKYSHVYNYEVTLEDLTGFKFDWEAEQNKAFEGACLVSASEAAKVATIFLCGKAISLIKEME